jgi:hypothetical protein
MLRISQLTGFGVPQDYAPVGLLYGETEGYSIDATFLGGKVNVIDTGTPANDLTNVLLSASNLVQASASSKYVFRADGSMVLLGAGVIPQSYDHLAGRYGILLEDTATNLVLASQDFDEVSWVKTRSAVSADQATAPDGTTTADELIEDATAGADHRAAHDDIITTGSARYCFSVCVKANTRSQVYIQVGDDDNSHNYQAGIFDLSTGQWVTAGTATGAGSAADARTARALENGWYRLSISGDIGGNTLSRPRSR